MDGHTRKSPEYGTTVRTKYEHDGNGAGFTENANEWMQRHHVETVPGRRLEATDGTATVIDTLSSIGFIVPLSRL